MSSRTFEIVENGLYMVFEVTEVNDIRLLHFGPRPFDPDQIKEQQKQGFRLMELQLTGEDRDEYHGRSHRATYPGLRMTYQEHLDLRNEIGRKLEIQLKDPITNLVAVQHIQFYQGTQVVRSWVQLRNEGMDAVHVEYITSFALTGIDKEGEQDRDTKMEL